MREWKAGCDVHLNSVVVLLPAVECSNNECGWDEGGGLRGWGQGQGGELAQ